MARELKLGVTCDRCSSFNFSTANSEGECERILERAGWTVRPSQVCPACKSGRKKQLKGDG